MKLTTREITLIGEVSRARGYAVEAVERRSDREFDLSFSGKLTRKSSAGCGFSAWLVLAFIGTLPWTGPRVAGRTDYPEMAREGDWSGVRDTNDARLWEIFHENLSAAVLA